MKFINPIIARISLRNLLRQKRRNILLGIGIAFGMMILVIANSFSHGISDLLFNKIIVNVAGHVQVSVTEKGRRRSNIIRDEARFVSIISNNVKNLVSVREAVATFGRAIGNGKSDNMVIVGIPEKSDAISYYADRIKSGNIVEFTNGSVEFPLLLSEDKARDLNVQYKDSVNMRFTTVNGQSQTARLTVVGITKSEGMFQGFVGYTPLSQAKKLLGYRPWETGGLQLILKNPKQTSVRIADILHDAFKPGLASIGGGFSANGVNTAGTMYGIGTNAESFGKLTNQLKLESYNPLLFTNAESALVSVELSGKLKLKTGETFSLTYTNRFDKQVTVKQFVAAGIFKSQDASFNDSVIANENGLYEFYFLNLPSSDGPKIATNSSMFGALAKEWLLMRRSVNANDMQKKRVELNRIKWQGSSLDVVTMYEMAEQVVQLESALNLITLIAVLVLFFIILIGVVNTLRMTIRERTREIGTNRAIGMQAYDVRNTFLLETFFLALFACVAGIILGIIGSGLLSLIRIVTDSPLAILLVNNHLYFKLNFVSMVQNLFLILAITIVTAWFPSSRAAKMSAANALRHYE
jgi:ABC-type lipoprotein release transport system permease subunit